MNINKFKKIFSLVFILALSFLSYSFFYNPYVPASTKFGDKNNTVKEIQTALNQKGYYNGNIDGIFGTATKEAVIKFQTENNLKADGIVGEKTAAALELTDADTNPTSQFSDSEIELLARIISAESRGEPYSGQVAVGAVILNRIEHPSFPNTLSGVIYQPGAFSCLNDGQINEPVHESAKQAAKDAINGADPSGGAIYYYNPERTSNSFMLSRPVITVIGKHKFCSWGFDTYYY